MIVPMLVKIGIVFPLIPPFFAETDSLPHPSRDCIKRPDELTAVEHAHLLEILDLRKVVGISPLSGSIFDTPEPDGRQDDFIATLSSEIRRQRDSLTVTPTDPISSSPRNDDLPDLIRQACRQLDRIANDLEDERLFSQADRLRAVCQQLRESVRSTDTACNLTPRRADESR